jgi:phage terminase large subunit-like protein
MDESARYFRKEWFNHFIHPELPDALKVQLLKEKLPELPHDLIISVAIDPASSQEEGADYTVIVTLGFSPTTRNYYVVDLFRERCTTEKQVKEMIRQFNKWSRERRTDGKGFVFGGFCIETYAYQATIEYWLKKFLREDFGLFGQRVFRRAENQANKTLRCSILSPMAEQRRLYFPYGTVRDIATNQLKFVSLYDVMEDELDEFPQGNNDDTVDALQRAYSVLIRHERKYADMGRYGRSGADQFLALENSTSFSDEIKQYFQ